MAAEKKDYSRTAATATRLITKFSRELSFQIYNAIHDEVTSKDTSAVTGNVTATGVVLSSDKSLITGSRLETGRLLILLTPEKAPSMNWKLNADAIPVGNVIGLFPGPMLPNLKGLWSIMAINELNPAGVPLLYELEIQQ